MYFSFLSCSLTHPLTRRRRRKKKGLIFIREIAEEKE
jgi:hypothetical protein